MKKYTAILIVITSLILTSCVSVGVIDMPVLTPPTSNLILNSHKVNLSNAFLAKNKHTSKDFKNLIQYDKYRLDSAVSIEAVQKLKEILKQGKMYSIGKVDSLGKDIITNNLPTIVLDSISIISKVETEPVYQADIGQYYASLMVPYYVKWKIIEKGVIVNNKAFSDTLWIEGRKAKFSTMADLVDFNRAVNYILKKTVDNYADEFSSSIKNIKRYYYKSGNNDFIRADYYLSQKEYDKAKDIWYKYIYSSKDIRGQAYVNLALYYEINGDLSQAIELVKKAVAIGNELAPKYLKVLEKRQAQTEKLYKIFNN